MVDMRINEMILGMMPRNQRVLLDASKATKVEFTEKGQIRKVPDHKMRMAAIETQRTLLETTRPKGVGVAINQQFNNGVPTGGPGAGISFESRLRQARERKGLVNVQEIESAEDAAMTTEEELAAEFEDFGGDEEGDEESSDESSA